VNVRNRSSLVVYLEKKFGLVYLVGAGLRGSNSGLRLKFAANGHVLVIFGLSDTRNG